MPPTAILRTVDLREIEISEEWSLHPFLASEPPATALVESIARVGVLRPPVLLQLSTENYQILCGRARLRTLNAGSSDIRSTPCLIISEDSSPQQILSYIIEDQSLSGTLSAMEKACFFSYCLKYMDNKEIASHFLPIFNEKIQPHTIRKLLELLKLEPDIQISVHNGSIGEKTAADLLKMSSGDRQLLHTVFMNLKLGGGKQKRLLSLCRDLAYREETTITELLRKPAFSEILTHPEMNQPQKAAVLLSSMQKMLFPQSISAEELFRKKVTAMKLPATCRVTHALSFETDAVSLTMDFKTLTEMERQLPQIMTLAADKHS